MLDSSTIDVPSIFHNDIGIIHRPQALTPPRSGFIPFDRKWLARSLPDRFVHQVENSPDQVALKTENQTLTYADLNRAANRLAHALIDKCGTDIEPIALLLSDDVASIVGLLGILKAGKFFVNLNPTMPPTAMQKSLRSIDCRLLIVAREHLALGNSLKGSQGIEVILVDTLEHTSYPTTNPKLNILPSTFAQIVPTSGSTGIPKNVLVTHEMLLHQSMIHINGYYISSADRLMVTTPLTFGSSLSDVFAALLGGAMLCPIRVQPQTLTTLISWLREEQITIYHSVSTLYRRMIQQLNNNDTFPHLRVIKLGGETIHHSDLQQFQQHFGDHCVLRVGLASSETNLITWYFAGKETEITTPTVPVGYAIIDKEILLFDEASQPVPQGKIGEIVVRSRFLSPGYWDNPELTATKFSLDIEDDTKRIYHTGDLGRQHADGLLEHLGRKDQMVKIRGFRVEMGAIEGELLELPCVKAVAVVAHDHPTREKELIAYIVPKTEPFLVSRLRADLSKRLPGYMIPLHFVVLDSLPLLPNGKIDRKALPELGNRRPELEIQFVLPANETEKKLATIWSKLLGFSEIGVHDNYFEMGGHSLLTMRLVAEIKKCFDVEIALKDFFIEPTIGHLAAILQRQDDEPDYHQEYNTGSESLAYVGFYTKVGEPDALAKLREDAQTKNQRQGGLKQAVLKSLPYPIATRLLQQIIQQPYIRRKYLSSRVALINEFLDSIDHRVEQYQALNNSLLFGLLDQYNIHPDYRTKNTSALYDTNQIVLEGIERLREVKREGRGLIMVTSHTYDKLWLQALQLGEYVVGGVEHILDDLDVDADIAQRFFLAEQMNRARQILQRGGIVKFPVDGHQGTSKGIEVPFHGRLRRFRTGFAELAMTTDTDAVMAISKMKPNEPVHIKFVGPFERGEKKMAYGERVELLVSQYIALLHDSWTEMPWMVPWYQMERHLNYYPLLR